MISIRECISESELISVRKKHIDFVSFEVEKRIDFYINLFEYLSYLQLHPKTRTETVKSKVNKIIHHSQYEPFIKIIFINEKQFDYTNLKSLIKYKPDAGNFAIVIDRLKKLKKISKSILEIDFSYGSLIKRRYYESRKLFFAPIGFLLKKIFDYENWFLNLDPDGV
ncbi:hypothetical protein FPG102_10675, partial [Flavobacterium psychrophilum]